MLNKCNTYLNGIQNNSETKLILTWFFIFVNIVQKKIRQKCRIFYKKM